MAVMAWFDGNEPIQLNKVGLSGQLKESTGRNEMQDHVV